MWGVPFLPLATSPFASFSTFLECFVCVWRATSLSGVPSDGRVGEGEAAVEEDDERGGDACVERSSIRFLGHANRWQWAC